MLTGANMDIKCWPYAFHHWIRSDNALPSRDQEVSPNQMVTGKNKEDFSRFKTFGCRVWVRPPGRRKAKFRINSRKGVFLGFLRNTTKNILWYDAETSKTKIATHARFEEGMNDLPIDCIPPNVVHLQQMQLGESIPEEAEIDIPVFNCCLDPFPVTLNKKIIVRKERHDHLGIVVAEDELNSRAYVKEMKDKSSIVRSF
mmetsp:Transcript_17708/g.26862  ORF Transcript_17708/g.26862 Transcript_17708/m.26862 type:complete len:200 (-) Transcript_17708:2195-2794(-)